MNRIHLGRSSLLVLPVLATALVAASAPAPAQEPPAGQIPPPPAEAAPQEPAPAQEELTLQELERRIDLLAAELEQARIGPAAAPEYRTQYGLGPAASKVYRAGQGVSIGGYGELLYQNFASTTDAGARSNRTDQLDLLRAVLYFGYKFDDQWVFNSELEFEHASTGAGGEASLEFAYLDFLWREELNARVGLLLLPVGFINEQHEPVTFFSASRPAVERVVIPTTWRENGAGVFGDWGDFSYRAYVVNGFDASGFSAAGLRDGRQQGAQAEANDMAVVGRVDWSGLPGLVVGASGYNGRAGQDLVDATGREIAAGVAMGEGHVQWNWRGVQVRVLGVTADVDDAARLNQALGFTGKQTIGDVITGYYAELGYDVLTALGGHDASLTPFIRWESYDTQEDVSAGFRHDTANDVTILAVGVAWQPMAQVIFKADWQNMDNVAGTGVDQFSAAAGFIF